MTAGASRLIPVLAAIVVFGLCGLVNLRSGTVDKAETAQLIAGAQPFAGEVVLKLSVTSEYEERLGSIGDGLYPHENLVEVHQQTTLAVGVEGDTTDVGIVAWSIPGTDLTEGEAPTGRQVSVRFIQPGTHRITVSTAHGTLHRFTCTARYVRRELRDLSDDDRDRYFSAVSVVYRTPQEEGTKLYGDSFRSAAWLVREHLYGAADRSCDHWHDDAGFLNHHVGITMQFEQSIQAVDPRVASHYWDYTLDAVLGDNYSQSVVFDDDWFGSADPNHGSHVISEGRWAFTPLLYGTGAREFSNITNPFGLLRSPWNTNRVPYLMRSRYTLGVRDALYNMPTCSDFANVLETNDLSFAKVSSELNGGLHGMVHIMLGGHWWTNASFAERMATHVEEMRSSAHIADQMLLGSKFLWRQGFVYCPSDCTGMSEESCVCECPAEVIKGRSAFEIMHLTGLLAIVPQIQSVLVQKIGFTYDEILAELCHVGHPGEMFTSAAPQDPIFMPLHGLSERFVQLIRILASKGILAFDDKWSYDHISFVLSDTRVVCDWTSVNDDEAFAPPTCVQNATCPGHRADDSLPFTDLAWVPPGTTFTNEEFYDAISPSNTNLPYVYDRLTTWPACPDRTIVPVEWRHLLRSSVDSVGVPV